LIRQFENFILTNFCLD